MSEIFRGYTMNVQDDPPNNGVIENTLLKAILSFLPVSGDTFVAAEHKHVSLYGPTIGIQIYCADTYVNIGATALRVNTVTEHTGIGETAPVGICHFQKSIGILSTDTGINIQVGSLVAEGGAVYTRSDIPNDPIMLSDCGTLTDEGVLPIMNRGAGAGLGRVCCGYGYVSATALAGSPPGNEQAFFRFFNGTVTLISNTINAVTTDTDGKLCIRGTDADENNSTLLKIKNRLGDTWQIAYFLWYASVDFNSP